MTAQPVSKARKPRQLTPCITRAPERVKAAQELRFEVFSREYEADLGAGAEQLDRDHFDDYCDHLLVIDEQTGRLAATTRILHGSEAARAGGFYSEGEFHLDALLSLPGTLAELGRTCVHPDYRSGATLSLLWAALAQYLVEHDVDYLIGCASIGMADGGHKAWRIARHLQSGFLSDETCRVVPRRAMPHLTDVAESDRPVDVPPLIKAYMRLGARVCGEPCWDPEFRCADLLVLLEVNKLADRYSRHFLRRGHS